MEEALGVGDAGVRVPILTPLSVQWPATRIVAGGSSFSISFISNSMSSMKWLSTKCDDAPQFDVMVVFTGPGVVEPTMNK